jgi:hypothetical protein
MNEQMVKLYNEYNSAGIANVAAAILAGFSVNSPQPHSITLTAGQHDIFIPTEQTPQKIYISVEEGSPVCVGALNMATAVIQDSGFALYADIKSNSAVVSYLIFDKVDNGSD